MKLSKKSKQRIYQLLPQAYLRSQEFLPGPITVEGKTHEERAAWWASQCDAYLALALDPVVYQLNRKRLDAIAAEVGFKDDNPYDSYDYQMDIMDHATGHVTEEETFEVYGAAVAEPTEPEHVPEPVGPTIEELWEEGRRLARPVLYLKALRKPTRKNRRTAIWTYRDKLECDPQPWVTIDLRQHPDPSLRADGILQIDENRPLGRFEVTFSHKRLPQAKRGQKTLYAVEEWDMPCSQILMKRAKRSIRKWERQMEHHQLLEYEFKWQASHPYHQFHGGGVYVQLGGWPVEVPDADAVSQLRKKLVLRTYAYSEPWLEVFKRGQRYECIDRIT